MLSATTVEGMPRVDVNISLSELQFEKKISKGGFGEVWKASYLGTDVAVKKMLKPDDAFVMRLIQRELTALQEIRHPNICLFIGLCLDNSDIQVVTEFIDGGTLWKLLKNRKNPLSWHTRLHFAVELAKAFTFLHAKNIIHRDLKSENILVDKNNHLKVCDFGLCRGEMTETNSKFMTKAGTETWMAPEIIIGSPYSLKADIFSFGVVLYELIVRDRPPDRSPMNAYNFEIPEFISAFPPECPKELANLAVACVAADSDTRPSMMEILTILKDIKSKLPAKEGSSKRESKTAAAANVSSPLPPPIVPASSGPIPAAINTLTSNLMPPPPMTASTGPAAVVIAVPVQVQQQQPQQQQAHQILPPPMNLAPGHAGLHASAPASTTAGTAAVALPASPAGPEAGEGGAAPTSTTKKKKKKKIAEGEIPTSPILPFALPPALLSASAPTLESLPLPAPLLPSPPLPEPILPPASADKPHPKSTPTSPRRVESNLLTSAAAAPGLLPPPIVTPTTDTPAIAAAAAPPLGVERLTSSTPSRRKLEVLEIAPASSSPDSVKSKRKSVKSSKNKDSDRLRTGSVSTTLSGLPEPKVATFDLPPEIGAFSDDGLPPPLLPPSEADEDSPRSSGSGKRSGSGEVTSSSEKRTIRHRKTKSRDESVPAKMKKRRSGE